MRIAFIGDSLTEGWPGESYLERLRELLPADELLNRGRAGDTIVGVELRMRGDGLEPVDLAFIWVGVNDAFMGGWSLPGVEEGGAQAGEPGLARLRAAYERLLAFTLDRAAQVVCVAPILPDDGVEGPFRSRVEEIAGMIGRRRPRRGPRTALRLARRRRGREARGSVGAAHDRRRAPERTWRGGGGRRLRERHRRGAVRCATVQPVNSDGLERPGPTTLAQSG